MIVLGPAGVASWPQTATIASTKAVDHDLCINHTSLGRWPSTIFFGDPNTLVEGNQWVFANIGGRWYGGAADWYRPGQACKDVTAATIAADAFYDPRMEPLRSWRPRPGETFGVMSTTPARAWPDMRTIDQRTNVVLHQVERELVGYDGYTGYDGGTASYGAHPVVPRTCRHRIPVPAYR